MDLETVLRDLDDAEPNVIVEPDFGAFCMVRSRTARPSQRPSSERLPLDLILAYLRENPT